MFKTLAIAAVVAFAPLIAVAAELPAHPFIHTSGSSSTIVIPDLGEVDFEIIATDADPEAARRVIEERLAQIRAAGEAAGVPADDIEARDVRKEIHKGAQAVPGVTAYDLKCSVHIKVKNLTMWAPMVSPLINMPNLDGFMTEFGTTEREKIEVALLGEAIKTARRRAEGMAAGFGKKVGEVSGVSAGAISNLTRAMGLAPTDNYYRGNSNRSKEGKVDLLAIVTLKFAMSADVIFRIK